MQLLNDAHNVVRQTLWIAMRILEERKNMLTLLTGETNGDTVKELYRDKIAETKSHIERIKKVIFSDGGDGQVLQRERGNRDAGA